MEKSSSYDFQVASSPVDYFAARILFKEYASSLGFDLCFQNFEQELSELEIQYSFPSGCLILIKHLENYIGCIGVRRFDHLIAELKRMYIQPDHRGNQLGEKLLKEALLRAKELGYKRVRLDTMNTMHAAIHLYAKAGFLPIPSYRYNPSGDGLFFEIVL